MRRRVLIKSGALSSSILLANGWLTGITSGQENTGEINIQFDPSGGGWKGGQDSHAATMGIWAPGWFEEDNRMSLTPGTYQLEIERTDTDQSIVFEMETPLESTIEASQILNDLFDSTGDIYDSPTIDIIGDSGSEEFSVSQTDGDENIFSAGDVFGTYLIRLNCSVE